MILNLKIFWQKFSLHTEENKTSEGLGTLGDDAEMIISISRSGLLKSCARFIIERSEIRKKQHDFKCVHFECRMVLFYTIWEKSRL